MTDHDRTPAPLHLLAPPYRDLIPVSQLDFLDANPRLRRGSAIVWELALGDWGASFSMVRRRPPGVALLMILPPSEEIDSVEHLLDAADRCRPHSILPFHPSPRADELTSVLRHPPDSIARVLMDYMTWRGLHVDIDTRRLVRSIVDLSSELKSVRAVARSLHRSRRALGRRFNSRGLPVPSHLLHFSRLLRASFQLQNTTKTLFEIARGLGYADGFALSNQMDRLTGIRPRMVRERAGWEWIAEGWLQTEAAAGKVELRPPRGSETAPPDPPSTQDPPSIHPSHPRRRRRRSRPSAGAGAGTGAGT